jgi:hypothetical protein
MVFVQQSHEMTDGLIYKLCNQFFLYNLTFTLRWLIQQCLSAQLSLRASSTQTFSFSLLFILASFSGVLFSLAFLCYSSTALAGGYSCVTLTLTLTPISPAQHMWLPVNPFVTPL